MPALSQTSWFRCSGSTYPRGEGGGSLNNFWMSAVKSVSGGFVIEIAFMWLCVCVTEKWPVTRSNLVDAEFFPPFAVICIPWVLNSSLTDFDNFLTSFPFGSYPLQSRFTQLLDYLFKIEIKPSLTLLLATFMHGGFSSPPWHAKPANHLVQKFSCSLTSSPSSSQELSIRDLERGTFTSARLDS